MLMVNDEFVKNGLVTNDGLMVGDSVPNQSNNDTDRDLMERGFLRASQAEFSNWYILMCRTGSELTIRDELKKHKIGVFAPTMSGKKVRRKGKNVWLPDRAVFGGYVFVCLPLDAAVMAAVKSLDHSYGLLMGSELPIHVPISNILIMMDKDAKGHYGKRVQMIGNDWIRKGAKVCITEGSIDFVYGVVGRVMSDRAEVLVKCMGAYRKMIVPLDSLSQAG